ncbi:MAG: GMC oxidoreductase [Anaerolineae bacterium]
MSRVAIVGSGIVGTTLAYLLTAQGHHVHLFEKGPEYPYPHTAQFEAHINRHFVRRDLPMDGKLRAVPQTGNIRMGTDFERFMQVGGKATRWEAITLRLNPSDFETRARFGRDGDWALRYDDLETYYHDAERLLGVSGTDDDNPFAPPRSAPYPLPPFELSYEDKQLAAQLAEAGIHIHTTPQARTRLAYEDRPGCVNFGVCGFCPIGARYSPGYHLQKALATGLCTLETNISVRRVIVDESGRARALLVQGNTVAAPREHPADLIILAPGAIEAARLLLLSANDRYRDGLGNGGGHVGQHLGYHHIHTGTLVFDRPVYPGQVGFWTGQSQQFVDHAARDVRGGVKIEFSAQAPYQPVAPVIPSTLEDVPSASRDFLHRRYVYFHAESDTTPEKVMRLSTEQADIFGDPFPHVHYQTSPFDEATYAFKQELLTRFADALAVESAVLSPFEHWVSGHHHLGTCRMSADVSGGVVDRYGKVHEMDGLYVVGGSSFASTGANNPTLTIVALALQTAAYLLEQELDTV